ncbi:restriction endonuclease subunit S [Schleiferiaceae bacterium]|nr:restriction endonuclease subunit S [Schleiferiaceae bacterium]
MNKIKLGDAGYVFNGNSINAKVKKEKYCSGESGLPYIATKDLTFKGEFDYENGVKIPFSELDNFKVAKHESVLICAEGGSAGRKIGFLNTDVCFGNKLFAYEPTREFCGRYVYYYFLSSEFQKDFKSNLKGIIGGVSLKKFKELEIPQIPLTKQLAIVSKLDQAFEAIDQAIANTEKSIQLTEDYFESALNKALQHPDRDTAEIYLNDACEIKSKLIDPKDEKYKDWIHVGAANIVSQKGRLVNLKKVSEENLISGKFTFTNQMVLYSKIRPYLRKIVMCDDKGLCSADIYPLTPKKGIILQSYLFFVLMSEDFTSYAINGSQRAGMPKVNRNHLFKYKFKCPSIEEQKSASSLLIGLLSTVEELQGSLILKKQQLVELKMSILEKAFKGELD